MTRINTKVSSPVANNPLSRTNADLQTALTRLGTGLRINTGKDDPADLTASEAPRSDIVSVEKAISNSERANQVIATADTALRQVSSLLNDIRGLAAEAANAGTLSEDQLAAHQLQVDSSLEAVNRIAQATSFQGRKLLDGSLDFLTVATANFDDVTDLNIHQVNLGTAGATAVEIAITAAAIQGSITATIPVASGPVAAAARLILSQGEGLAPQPNYAHLGEVNASDTIEDVIAGANGVTGLTGDLVFELSGMDGAEVFSFAQNTTGAQIESAINLVSDVTGVTATFAGTTLTLQSTAYGSSAFVAINVISDAGGFEASLSDTRRAGTDIEAAVNGVNASGDGNTLSMNTTTLDLTATIAAGKTETIEFSITGGGALFQIGPDMVSDQQARIRIGSVNTASLGGSKGRLYQLGSGESAALDINATTALQIVEEVCAKVTSLRGRLGAFQKSTLEANIFTLNEAAANLTEAENAIRDADFAAETASLTRGQILVQSGISVLSIANSNPQNVLALLR